MSSDEELNNKFKKWANRYGITPVPTVDLKNNYPNELCDNVYLALFDSDNNEKAAPGLIASDECFDLELLISDACFELECTANEALNLLKDNTWHCSEVDINEEWDTATVTLLNKNDESYVFNVTDLDDSGYIPNGFFSGLEDFSKKECEDRLTYLPIDGFFRFILIPHKAADELNALLKKFSLSYY